MTMSQRISARTIARNITSFLHMGMNLSGTPSIWPQPPYVESQEDFPENGKQRPGFDPRSRLEECKSPFRSLVTAWYRQHQAQTSLMIHPTSEWSIVADKDCADRSRSGTPLGLAWPELQKLLRVSVSSQSPFLEMIRARFEGYINSLSSNKNGAMKADEAQGGETLSLYYGSGFVGASFPPPGNGTINIPYHSFRQPSKNCPPDTGTQETGNDSALLASRRLYRDDNLSGSCDTKRRKRVRVKLHHGGGTLVSGSGSFRKANSTDSVRSSEIPPYHFQRRRGLHYTLPLRLYDRYCLNTLPSLPKSVNLISINSVG